MDLLTVDETARLLKVTPITVRRYIAAGRLQGLKVGKGVRIRREAIDQLLRPIEPSTGKPTPAARRARLFSRDDSLFGMIGVAAGDPGDSTDVSDDKLRYLAEAYGVDGR
jgi:excisionase family DNA binding protein